jgi:hypothetical protein
VRDGYGEADRGVGGGGDLTPRAGGTRRPSAETRPRSRGSVENGNGHGTGSANQRYEDVFEDDDKDQHPSAPSSHSQSTSQSTPLAAPTITHTLPSPAIPQDSQLPSNNNPNTGKTVSSQTPAPAAEDLIVGPGKNTKTRRRASFHPPPLTTAFSREVLLTSRTGVLPGGAGLTLPAGNGGGTGEGGDGDEAGKDAIMDSVEELLEGFDWTGSSMNMIQGNEVGGRKKGSADAIESRLLDELSALDSVSPWLAGLSVVSSSLAVKTLSRRCLRIVSASRLDQSGRLGPDLLSDRYLTPP